MMYGATSVLDHHERMPDIQWELQKAKVPTRVKPRRPYTPYNLFYLLERERVVQTDSNGETKYKNPKENAREPPNKRAEDEIPLPARYKGVVLSPNWYDSNFKEKRKHRKSHGKISFQQLTDMISKNWATIDEETKNYCQAISEITRKRYKEELSRYNAAQKILELQKEKSEMMEMREKRMALFKPKVAKSPPRQSTIKGSRKAVVTPERLPLLHQSDKTTSITTSTGVRMAYHRKRCYIPTSLPHVPPPSLPSHSLIHSTTKPSATIPPLPLQLNHTEAMNHLRRHHVAPYWRYLGIENSSELHECELNHHCLYGGVNWYSYSNGRTHTKPRTTHQRENDESHFDRHEIAYSRLYTEICSFTPEISADVKTHLRSKMMNNFMTPRAQFQQKNGAFSHQSQHRHHSLNQNKQNKHECKASSTKRKPFQCDSFHYRPTHDECTKNYEYIANAMWCYSAASESEAQSQSYYATSKRNGSSNRNDYWKPSCDTMTHDEAMKICDIIGTEHSSNQDEQPNDELDEQPNDELFVSFPGGSPCRSVHSGASCSQLFAEESPLERLKNDGLDEHDIDDFICEESPIEKDFDCDYLKMPWV